MMLKFLRILLVAVLVGLALGLCLFFERFSQSSGGLFGSVGRETMAVFRDPGTQWMVNLCAGIYFVTFTLLGKRKVRNAERSGPNSSPAHQPNTPNYQLFLSPDLWLCGLLLIAALAYAFDYKRASTSTQALVLLAGAAIGKGARLWANWGKAEGGKLSQQPETPNPKLQTLLVVLLLLLGVASLWHSEGAMQFQYRGLNRWSGPWDNPNIFGMLMGTGVVIGIGMLVSDFKFQRLVCLAILGLCGVGLLKSYSRGAWLGAALGLAFLASQHFRFQNLTAASFSRGSRISRFICWLGRNWRPLSVVLLSVIVLAFWQFRQTEWHPARRAFSVGNKNDFSWRNRIAAWEGSLAMMADRPVAGFGWNQPEKIYDQLYRPPKVAEGMAIQLNHFFTLAMSLGLPALICFGMYVGISLTRNAKSLTQSLSPPDGEKVAEGRVRGWWPDWMQSTCRAGAVVLLIGLWFDGGLFNLATAAPLWVLLELGRGVTRPTSSPVSDGSCISRFKLLALPSFFAVLLLTGLFWTRTRDPFHREWLSLKTPDGVRLSAVMVMPDRGGPFPVVVFAHGAGGSVESNGEKLRQFAELGLAAVGIEYDKTNQTNFDAQFAALLDELGKKSWARSNAVAWVGNSLGAQRELRFLARHPERQPAALVRLNGGWVEGFDRTILRSPSSPLGHLPVWIAHGENDEVFPVGDVRKVAEVLRAAGADVRLDIFSGRGHGFGEDQPLLVKMGAEFCARELGGTTSVPVNVRPGLWYFWLPAGLIGCVLVVRRARMRSVEREPAKTARWLTVCASVAVIVATLVSAAHLGLPLLRATPSALRLARQWCVRPALRVDFDWLAQQPAAKECLIRDLLEHLDLASLQRGQSAAWLPENMWREFALSPWIEGTGENIVWRRELWETIQPRVRRETDAEQAAQIVVRALRMHTTAVTSARERSVSDIWAIGEASGNEFERLYVASLRSIGVGAKLNHESLCEMFYNGKWQQAPRSAIDSPPPPQR